MDEKINNLKNKTKQAELMEIKTPKDGYWGNYSSKICGSVGGAIDNTFTEDTISNFEWELVKKDKKNNEPQQNKL